MSRGAEAQAREADAEARVPKYDEDTVAALSFYGVLGAPTGKRRVPVIGELVPRLGRFEELNIIEDTERSLISMSAGTVDRRLMADRARIVGGARNGQSRR